MGDRLTNWFVFVFFTCATVTMFIIMVSLVLTLGGC